MNVKFILFFFIACNIFSTIFSFGCATAGAACNVGGDGVITTFLLLDPATNLFDLGGFELTAEFTNATTAQVTPFTGGTSSPASGFTVFLDGLKMGLGMLTLLTPIPLMDYMFSLGFPFYVNLILMPLLLIAYIAGIMEFIRGSQLGK